MAWENKKKEYNVNGFLRLMIGLPTLDITFEVNAYIQ